MKNNPTQFEVILNQSSINMLGTGDGSSNENFTDAYEIGDIDEQIQAGVPKLTQILGILGIFISIIGIIGNFFSIIVLTRKSMKKLSTYSYLLGLSICDEISLIFTVYILLQYCWPILRMSHSFTRNHQLTLIYVLPVSASTQALSVWITMAYTFDRYLYVCHPYYGGKFCTRKRASVVLICLYLLAFIYSIPQFLERENVTHDILGTKHIFSYYTKLGQNSYFVYAYHVFLYCAFVVFVPFTTIVILNGFLVFDIIKSNRRHRGLSLNYRPSVSNPPSNGNANGNLIHHSSQNGNGLFNTAANSKHTSLFSCLFKRRLNQSSNVKLIDSSQQVSLEPCLTPALVVHLAVPSPATQPPQQNHRLSYDKNFTLRNDVTIMLIGLIVVFLICHLPSTVLRIITFKNLSIIVNKSYYSSLDVSNFLVVTNSTLNCIMYVMLGKKFRKEFLATFISKCCYQKLNNNNNNLNNFNRVNRPSITTTMINNTTNNNNNHT